MNLYWRSSVCSGDDVIVTYFPFFFSPPSKVVVCVSVRFTILVVLSDKRPKCCGANAVAGACAVFLFLLSVII